MLFESMTTRSYIRTYMYVHTYVHVYLYVHVSKLTPFPEQRSPLEPVGQVRVVSEVGDTHARFKQAFPVPHGLPFGTNPNPVASASVLKKDLQWNQCKELSTYVYMHVQLRINSIHNQLYLRSS